MAFERERSPRRGGVAGPAGIPLAALLFERGILDESSADYVQKAPYEVACEVLMTLGPEVRNPSGYVTRRVKELSRGAAPVARAPAAWHAPAAAAAPVRRGPVTDVRGIIGARASISFPPLQAPAPFKKERPEIKSGDLFTVDCNGIQVSLTWDSQESVVQELVTSGILDEGSADFLMQAPEHMAKEIVSCLLPDVRNPSAFVTRKLKELRQQGGMVPSDGGLSGRGPAEPFNVHFNGSTIPIVWTSKEAVCEELLQHGVLDQGSADFLMKAPEHLAKDIVSSLGPDVRNPSAFVTRRCKETSVGRGGASSLAPAPAATSLTVYNVHTGTNIVIDWHTRSSALEQLVSHGILDENSADFLFKIPEDATWDIVSRLGPDVRNPSGFVTREAKKLVSR